MLKATSSGAEIPVRGSTLIGKGSHSDVLLTVGRPSKKHALLIVSDGDAWLFDLKSTNGTFVNECRIDGRRKIYHSDRIRFGAEEFLFLWPSRAGDPGEATGGSEPFALAAASGAKRVPPAWLSIAQEDGKTHYIPREEWERERAGIPVAGPFTHETESPMLVFIKEGREPSYVRLTVGYPEKGQEWTIGSSRECDICLDLSGVSRFHAKISYQRGKWKIVGYLARNGTFVNGRRILAAYLTSGDTISFGLVECSFHLPQGLEKTDAFGKPNGILRRIAQWFSRT